MRRSTCWTLCGLSVLFLASGCKAPFSRLAFWKSSEPTTLSDNSVPSPSQTAVPAIAGTANPQGYPDTGAQSYATSPYAGGSMNRNQVASPYGPQAQGAGNFGVQTADARSHGTTRNAPASYGQPAAPNYQIPSQYGANSPYQNGLYGGSSTPSPPPAYGGAPAAQAAPPRQSPYAGYGSPSYGGAAPPHNQGASLPAHNYGPAPTPTQTYGATATAPIGAATAAPAPTPGGVSYAGGATTAATGPYLPGSTSRGDQTLGGVQPANYQQ